MILKVGDQKGQLLILGVLFFGGGGGETENIEITITSNCIYLSEILAWYLKITNLLAFLLK